jgi:hypothetical protein
MVSCIQQCHVGLQELIDAVKKGFNLWIISTCISPLLPDGFNNSTKELNICCSILDNAPDNEAEF